MPSYKWFQEWKKVKDQIPLDIQAKVFRLMQLATSEGERLAMKKIDMMIVDEIDEENEEEVYV